MILTQKEADEWKFPLVVLFRPEMAPDSIYFFFSGGRPLSFIFGAVFVQLSPGRAPADDDSAADRWCCFRLSIPPHFYISGLDPWYLNNFIHFFWANAAYSELNVALFFELLRYMDHPQCESNQVSLELFRSRNIILTFETIRLKDSRHSKWRRQYY